MDKTLKGNYEYILSYISPRIQNYLRELNEKVIENIQEIRIRSGRPVVIVSTSGSSFLTDRGKTSYILSSNCIVATENEIIDTVNKMCGYSMHSHYEDLLNGYITLPNGSRVGICGTAVYEKEIVKGIDNINSINIRIPRNVYGVSEEIFENLFSKKLSNLIIAGPPSSGKTTMLRDIAYQLSSGRLGKYHKICVIDERKEIFSSKADLSVLGPNSDVLSGFPKGRGISMAVRTMSPEFIICDEIGGADEVNSILDGVNCGVVFILSIHASTLSELRNKKIFRALIEKGGFENVAMLTASDCPCRIKRIYSSGELFDENMVCYSNNFNLRYVGDKIDDENQESHKCNKTMCYDA